MGEDALIRLENLKSLGHSPADLVRLVGSTYPYWRDLLAGQKSFGEKAARNIEAKLGLQRGTLDVPRQAGERRAANNAAGTAATLQYLQAIQPKPQPAPRAPVNCTSRRVGNTVQTDCW